METNRKTALITGASAGLGVAFAEQLAARGYDIALTARSQAPMEKIAAELSHKYEVTATVHPQDLSEAGSARDLVAQLSNQGIMPDVLINNAAFGLSGPFVDYAPERLTAMLQLNMVSLTELTLLLGRQMSRGNGGRILLVSSGAAYQPTPMIAGYGATKAYILSLGVALNVELAPKVSVTVVSPGPMDTGFNAVSGYELPPSFQRMAVPVHDVAKVGLDALFAGRPSVIPGRMNQLGALTGRLLSRHATAKLFARMATGK